MTARRIQSKQNVDLWLVAIVVVAGVVGAALVSRARNWGLMTDELLYTEMGRNVAGSLIPLPQVRGDLVRVNQVLYPILIAPLVGPLSMPTAYPLVAAFNAIVMASAAIPVYLLTRFASGSRVCARWAAACAVALPWLALASKVLPDATAYTALCWAVYAIARTAGGEQTGRASAKRDALALLAIVVTYLVRSQFIVLFGVWIAVVVLGRVSEAAGSAEGARDFLRRGWRALWRTPIERPVVVGSFALIALVLLVTPIWLLGLYTSTVGPSSPVAPQGLWPAIINHLGVMAVALLGLPFIFGLPWIVSALGRVKDRPQNQSALTLLVAAVVLIYVAATFNQRFGDERVLERYLFYVAPLLLVAAASFFAAPPRNAWLFAVPAAVGVILLNQTDAYGLSANVTLGVNHAFSPSQIGLVVLQSVGDLFGLSIAWLLMIVGVGSAVMAWLLINRGRSTLAMAIVFTITLVGLASTTIYSVVKVVDHQNSVADRVYGDRTGQEKAWVDSAICSNCTASLSFSPTVDVEASTKRDPSELGGQEVYERVSNWWDVEFWNSQFENLYVDDPRQPPTFGTSRPVTLDWTTGALGLDPADGSGYLLVAERNPKFQPQPADGSEPVARNGLKLFRLTNPPLAAWATRGLTRLGWVPAGGAELRVYSPASATATTRVRINARFAGTRRGYAGGIEITGADASARGIDVARTLTWVADVPVGGYAEFGVRWRGDKGARNAHVEQISAVVLR